MKFEVNGSKLEWVFMNMSEDTSLAPKLDGSGQQKKSPDGRPLYNGSGLTAIKIKEGKRAGQDKNVSLSILEQPAEPLEFGKEYRLDGPALITPYASDGSFGVSYSVIGSRIVPVGKEKKSPAVGVPRMTNSGK